MSSRLFGRGSLSRDQPAPRHPRAGRPQERWRRDAARADARQRRDGDRPPPERARVRRADQPRSPAPSPSGSRPSRPSEGLLGTGPSGRGSTPDAATSSRFTPARSSSSPNWASRRRHTRHRQAHNRTHPPPTRGTTMTPNTPHDHQLSTSPRRLDGPLLRPDQPAALPCGKDELDLRRRALRRASVHTRRAAHSLYPRDA